ncbi:hypothetical protein AVEN_223809-1 [Araneus ventricosus]|uniref:Uncharacterized protein n=1 Tax=Araneus ventricosus TaxID=182803 RepID=A0A4Y2DN81_ARAVE|nr:hypothetical protein AVEN_223809-1 [Araneus ventricosus]
MGVVSLAPGKSPIGGADDLSDLSIEKLDWWLRSRLWGGVDLQIEGSFARPANHPCDRLSASSPLCYKNILLRVSSKISSGVTSMKLKLRITTPSSERSVYTSGSNHYEGKGGK